MTKAMQEIYRKPWGGVRNLRIILTSKQERISEKDDWKKPEDCKGKMI